MRDPKQFDTEMLIGQDIQRIMREREEEERLQKETAEQEEKKKIRRRKSAPYSIISYLFVILFLCLIAYLVYFQVSLKKEILQSPYNRRVEKLYENTTRGKIISADGEILAETVTAEDGEEIRRYPYGRMFAHVIGYSAKGGSGLESVENYDLLTSHENPLELLLHDLSGKKDRGDSAVTTLRTDLQNAAYEALGDRRGAVVAMNAETGEILAMVSKPDFDPNTIVENWSDITGDSANSQLVNRATQGRYPPGSVFKIVTALAYAKNHDPDSFSYDCSGELTIDDYTVHCSSGAHGELDLTSAFAVSCNGAFATMGLETGGVVLRSTGEGLLFNKNLPCDLLYNKSSLAADSGTDLFEMLQTSFGQGKTTVSPYHMALIVSAIANDGVLMRPYLIDRIENAAGDIISKKGSVKYDSLMTEEESSYLQKLLRAVVEEGTGSGLNSDAYRAYGKTGTANYTRSDGSLGAHGWFAGYIETEDGPFVVSVVVEDGGSGAESALPVARRLFEEYYG